MENRLEVIRYDSRFTPNPRSGGVRCDLIELRPMDAFVSWNTSFPTLYGGLKH
jgi:hypothetical protein